MAGPDTVLITTAEGIVQSLVPVVEAGEDIQYYPGLICPGFINCHCHLELSHMKGVLPEGSGLIDFLLGVLWQRNQPADTAKSATFPAPGAAVPADRTALLAAAEQSMLDAGIVAVGDICNTTDTLPVKTAGRLFYHNFIEAMGFIESSAPDRLAQSLQVFQAFAEAYTLPIEANSLVPHAPYSVSPRLFEGITGFPGNHLLTIHNQESAEENSFYLTGTGDFLRLYQALGLDVSFFRGTGRRSLASYLPYFYRNQHLLLVHNVATTQEDLEDWAALPTYRRPDLYWCLCPNANLYIGGQLPDVELLAGSGLPVVIGTDSLASNHQLSILEEIKVLQRAVPQLPTSTLLRWATYNGAEALQLDSILGSFTPGKQPGVLLLENMENDRFTAGTTVQRLL